MSERGVWTVQRVPALSWWSERIVIGVLVVELAVFAAAASEVPGMRIVMLAVFAASVVPAFVAWRGHKRLLRRLFPGDGLVPSCSRRLSPVLMAGRPVAAAERGEAGRLVCWQLSQATCSAWGAPAGLAAILWDGGSDGRGHPYWSGWSSALVAVAVLAIAVAVLAMRNNARWRRVARDPALVEVPSMEGGC